MLMAMAGVKDVEMRHFAALRAVAEEGSFGRAAARLGFSQAAISQQIAGLEKAVGEAVFDRPGGPRPVELTPVGRLLLRHAEAILDRLSIAEMELEQLRSGEAGRLVVGTFQSVSVKLLPAVVGALRAEAPALDIRLYESDSNEELLERLASDQLDLTFVVGPVEDERLEGFEVTRDPFVAILPAGDAPSSAVATGVIPTASLDARPLVGQQESSCQTLVDAGLQDAGVHPHYVFRSNDNGAVQAMVRAGMGAAVMPLLAVDTEDPGVRVLRLDPPLPDRSVMLAVRRGRTRAPAADRFIELAMRARVTTG